MCSEWRAHVRSGALTPALTQTFLELISFYKRLLGEKRELNGQLITRLDTGLSTLRKTANDVAALQVRRVRILIEGRACA